MGVCLRESKDNSPEPGQNEDGLIKRSLCGHHRSLGVDRKDRGGPTCSSCLDLHTASCLKTGANVQDGASSETSPPSDSIVHERKASPPLSDSNDNESSPRVSGSCTNGQYSHSSRDFSNDAIKAAAASTSSISSDESRKSLGDASVDNEISRSPGGLPLQDKPWPTRAATKYFPDGHPQSRSVIGQRNKASNKRPRSGNSSSSNDNTEAVIQMKAKAVRIMDEDNGDVQLNFIGSSSSKESLHTGGISGQLSSSSSESGAKERHVQKSHQRAHGDDISVDTNTVSSSVSRETIPVRHCASFYYPNTSSSTEAEAEDRHNLKRQRRVPDRDYNSVDSMNYEHQNATIFADDDATSLSSSPEGNDTNRQGRGTTELHLINESRLVPNLDQDEWNSGEPDQEQGSDDNESASEERPVGPHSYDYDSGEDGDVSASDSESDPHDHRHYSN